MSSETRDETNKKQPYVENLFVGYVEKEKMSKKVNIDDLMFNLRDQQKKDKRSNIVISVSVLSAMIVIGTILTL